MTGPTPLLDRLDEGRVKFELLGTRESLARLGRFVVFARVGAGAMGVVYQAYDPELDRGVAIKLLHPSHAHAGARRLRREAQAMARLAHPNVVQVYEVGELEAHVYLVMELVRGADLRAWQAAAPRDWRATLTLYTQAGRGLAAMHAHGLVHCDFKPENVLVGEDGRAQVGDFGLAQPGEAQDDAAVQRLRERSPELASTRSNAGGTPRYMPPERLRGAAADAAGDQYGFCVALYEALDAGQFRAFEAGQSFAARALAGEAPPLLTGVPTGLARAVARGLAREPAQRWPDLPALLAELARVTAPRRTWQRGLLAGLALGLLGGAAYGVTHGGAAACDGGAAQLAAVWGAPQRASLRAAVAATGLSYAADTGARVEASLDEYAAGWAALHRGACEAHRRGELSQGLLDRSMRCLAARRADLEGLVAQLAHVDAAALERAHGAALALPSLTRCGDAAALLADVAPPSDPTVALAVHATRDELAAARAALRLGDLEAAPRRAARALAQALASEYEPVVAEALLAVGEIEAYREDRSAAESALTRAAWTAIAVGSDELLVQASAGIGDVLALGGRRWPETRTWLRLARTLAARVDPGGPGEVKALLASGRVEIHAGDYVTAQAHLERALALVDQRGEGGGRDALAIVNQLGLAVGRRGDYAGAAALFEREAGGRAALYGEHHPSIAGMLTNRAVISRGAGHIDEALADFERALALWTAAFGPDHPDVGLAEGNVASALLSRGRPGDHERAEEHLRRAIALRERWLGPADPALATELSNLAVVHIRRLELAAAEALYRRALTIRERTLGPDHPLVSEVLDAWAVVAGLRGDPAAEERMSLRSLAIGERTVGAHHPDLHWALQGLARAALARGDLAGADRWLRRAEADQRAAGESFPITTGLRGRLALRRGELARARERLESSLAAQEGRPLHSDSADVLVALAELELGAGRPAAARALASRAAEFYRAGGPDVAWRQQEIAALLGRIRSGE